MSILDEADELRARRKEGDQSLGDDQYIAELEEERNAWKRSAIERQAEIERLRAPHSAAIHRHVMEQTLRAERAEARVRTMEAESKRFRSAVYELITVYGPGRWLTVGKMVGEIERRAAPKV